MKSKALFVLLLALAVGLSGCISFNETVYPAVNIPALPPGKEIRLQLVGFDAMITSYIPVYGYSTVVGGDCWYGPHGRYCGPYSTTCVTETYIPQLSPTAAFRDRATEILEKCGFILKAIDPQYRVEVNFSGPFELESDTYVSLAWNLLTLLTADYAAQMWQAKLKIYDTSSNRLLHTRDFAQRYEVTVWGPIPIFSPGASSKTKFNSIQSWCLTALTDQALAEAVAFISARPK